MTIALPRAGRVEGTLVGFASPPHVYAESPANDWSDLHEATVVGDQFAFTGLPPGSYTIDALHGGVPIDGTPAECSLEPPCTSR